MKRPHKNLCTKNCRRNFINNFLTEKRKKKLVNFIMLEIFEFYIMG